MYLLWTLCLLAFVHWGFPGTNDSPTPFPPSSSLVNTRFAWIAQEFEALFCKNEEQRAEEQRKKKERAQQLTKKTASNVVSVLDQNRSRNVGIVLRRFCKSVCMHVATLIEFWLPGANCSAMADTARPLSLPLVLCRAHLLTCAHAVS